MNDYSTMPKMCLPPNPKGLQTAVHTEAEYHWSESMYCWVPIVMMHPKWARNALNKFLEGCDPLTDVVTIAHARNLELRANTPYDIPYKYDRV